MIRQVSIRLIEKAAAERWIRQLAIYYWLKNRFSNSCLYNYKSRMGELAAMLNISERTFYRYVNQLKDLGLAKEYSANLMLISKKEFKSRRKARVTISEENSLFEIECMLYGKILEKKARGMAFRESLRRFETGEQLKCKLPENPFCPSISIRSIAKLINSSEYKAFQVLNTLKRLNILTYERQKPKLIDSGLIDLNAISDLPGYRFHLSGKTYQVYGVRIDFVEYPLFLPKMTLQRYKHYCKSTTCQINNNY